MLDQPVGFAMVASGVLFALACFVRAVVVTRRERKSR